MAKHGMRTPPEPFQATWDGLRLFEVVRWARASVGDTVVLYEYDAARPLHHPRDRFTGRTIEARVTYVSAVSAAADGWSVLGLAVLNRIDGPDRRLPPTLGGDL